MYKLNPPHVYIHESVRNAPKLNARAEAVIAALVNRPPVTVYRDEDLPRMIREEGLLANRRWMGTMDDIPDPILLLNTFRFDGRREERMAFVERECGVSGFHTAEALAGYGPFDWWNSGLSGWKHPDVACRPCWRVHLQNGCAHKCHYCGLGGMLAAMLNVEEYLEHFARLIDAHPWQETYLLEDDADVLGLEPEIDCTGPIIDFFGTLPDRYVILHTKSANVDWMVDRPHNGKTIVVWSISGRGQSERFEPVCGTLDERISAARTLQEAGYPIRYKFKPIIPVRSWRTDASEAIARIFEHTRPDVISLACFMWVDVDGMKQCLDPDALDPAFLAAAENARESMVPHNTRPFPEDLRAEVYQHYLAEIRRHDPDVPVSISTESLDLWKRLGPALGADWRTYTCGCGPQSTPGRKVLPCNPYAVAGGGPVGGFETL